MISGRTPEEYRDFFAEVFADLDANPRKTGVRFRADDLVIDLDGGNPVFTVGGKTLRCELRGRWLPEHPVPLKFSGARVHVLGFVPTSGNRVKVRT